MPEARLLVISGLKREARIFERPGVLSICGSADTLRSRLGQTAALPLELVVSFGICGALDPKLRSGDLVVGSEVVSRGERLASDQGLSRGVQRCLSEAGERVVIGRVASVVAPVLSVEAKAALRLATDALVVDMESEMAASFANARGLPFLILRAVSDTARRSLPALVANVVSASGEADLGAVFAAIVRAPGQLAGTIAAARDSNMALRSLRRCCGIVCPVLGLGSAQL
ncbi:MAG: phosphorylase [Hyphomicrobiales bacterium]|nr:phosphorylase [Hyphomicrobiales bacterium]